MRKSKLEKKVAKQGVLLKLIKPELKYIDFSSGSTGIVAAGNFFLLNGVAEGLGPTARIGQRIMMRKLEIRGSVEFDNTDLINNVVRIMIVYDKVPSGVQFTLLQLLEAQSVNSPRSRDFLKRLTVLSDRRMKLMDVTNFEVNIITHNKKINKLVEYTANNNNITGIATGALYLFMSSNVTANPPELFFRSRVTFFDS